MYRLTRKWYRDRKKEFFEAAKVNASVRETMSWSQRFWERSLDPGLIGTLGAALISGVATLAASDDPPSLPGFLVSGRFWGPVVGGIAILWVVSCMVFYLRYCNIATLLRWAATSRKNFETMKELRTQANAQGFGLILRNLTAGYDYFQRRKESPHLREVRLTGSRVAAWHVLPANASPSNASSRIDLGKPVDPVAFELVEPVRKAELHLEPDPYDIRVATGVLNRMGEKARIWIEPDGTVPFATARLQQNPAGRSGLNYCLRRLGDAAGGLGGERLPIQICKATYGEIMDSCDALLDEALVFGVLAHDLQLSPRTILKKMPWRYRALASAGFDVEQMLFRPAGRAAGIGIACVTTFATSDYKREDPTQVVIEAVRNRRDNIEPPTSKRVLMFTHRSQDIGTYPSKNHAIPAGMFSVLKSDETAYWEGDCVRVLIKELFEEVFNVREAQDDHERYDREHFDQAVCEILLGGGTIEWKPSVRFSGICFDMLTLRPELCFTLDWPLPNWERVFVQSANLNTGIDASPVSKHANLQALMDAHKSLVKACRPTTNVDDADPARLSLMVERLRVQFNYETAKAGRRNASADEIDKLAPEDWVQSGLAAIALSRQQAPGPQSQTRNRSSSSRRLRRRHSS